jgi:hypothetical protein
MEDIHGTIPGEPGCDPGSAGDVLAVDEDPDVSSEVTRLVPKFESEPRISGFECVEEMDDRLRVDLFVAFRAELP